MTAGTKLGPYEILAPIGAGGMGEVWKARDTRLDRVVAVKVSKDQFSERFEREARAVAALNHPHICQLYDVGPNYLVMEFVEGAPLKGPLPLEKAVEYAGQILDALDAAHRKGITHRDLKPANILVTKQGIKLLDFGLAKQSGPLKETDGTLTTAITSQGQILGTLQYMSPEQLNGKEADARSDLFSFGCVLYEMLTGRRAFEGHSAASVIAAILEREPAPLDVSPPLERVIRTCLAKDPDQRFQTALDLKRTLAWAVEQQPAVEPHRYWWVAVAVALVIAAGVGGWALSHFRQPSADQRVIRFQIDPPDGGRFGGGSALSPDGKNAAYIASVNGKTGLWVRPLDSATPRLLAGTENAIFPFWSPDNRFIAFFTGLTLQRVDLEGGAPMRICDVLVGLGGAWSNDGHILFAEYNRGLSLVSASGGVRAMLTTLGASEVTHYSPQILPDNRFLYSAQGKTHENNGVYAASLAKPAERVRLLTTDTNALYALGADGQGYLMWRSGRTLVAQGFEADNLKLAGEPHAIPGTSIDAGVTNVAVSHTGSLLYGSSDPLNQLTWFDRAGKPVGVVEQPGLYLMPRLSPDGQRLAAVSNRASGLDLWLLPVGRGVLSRFTVDAGFHTFPVWSPDGRAIVFASGQPLNLFRKEANGAGTEQRLTQSLNTQLPTDWSHDGRWILYNEVEPSAKRDIWVLPTPSEASLLGDAKPRPYLRTPADGGRFSPEPSPRWVAYTSDESGQFGCTFARFRSREASFRFPRMEADLRSGAPPGANCSTCRQQTG